MPRPLPLAALALALAAPFVGAAWGSARVVRCAGDALACALASALPLLAAPSPSHAPGPPPLAREALVPPRDQPTFADVLDVVPRVARGRRHALPAEWPLEHRLHVGAAEVLRLARSGILPAGDAVPASGARPAGLALRGVGAYDVGLRDGDVLTDVAGVPATSASAVVQVVIEARKRRVPALAARVWRAEVPWQLVVEMPYPR